MEHTRSDALAKAQAPSHTGHMETEATTWRRFWWLPLVNNAARVIYSNSPDVLKEATIRGWQD